MYLLQPVSQLRCALLPEECLGYQHLALAAAVVGDPHSPTLRGRDVTGRAASCWGASGLGALVWVGTAVPPTRDVNMPALALHWLCCTTRPCPHRIALGIRVTARQAFEVGLELLQRNHHTCSVEMRSML